MLSSKSIFSLLFISWKSDNEKFVKSPLPGAKFIFLTAASCTLDCHYSWSSQIWSENYKSWNRVCAPTILKLLLVCTIKETRAIMWENEVDGSGGTFRLCHFSVIFYIENLWWRVVYQRTAGPLGPVLKKF